jgi:V/A-type H+/Na+-transporting ATPase subunit K
MNWGYVIGLFGIALCVLLCGMGSAMALNKTGQAAAGVLSEEPKRFSKVLVLVVLPATQGIYGFVYAIVAFGSLAPEMSIYSGLAVLLASLPLTINGLISAIFQGKSSVSCIYAVAKKEQLSGKLILFPAMIETYAILSLVISLLLLA